MKKIKITILAIAMLQMITAGFAAGLSELQAAFPDNSTLSIQMILSCSGVIVLVMSLFTGKIYQKFTRRNSVIFGLALMIFVAFAGYLYHPNLFVLYVYSALIGLSVSLYIPAVGSVIIDYFDGKERAVLTGNQSAFCSLGGIVISFLGGILASVHWYSIYLVYICAVPTLILSILFFPKDEKKEKAEDDKVQKEGVISKEIIKYGLICLTFVTIHGASGNNLSLFIANENFGSTVLTGALGSIGMIGGVCGGVLFGKFLSNYEDQLFAIIFLLESVFFLMLTLAPNITIVAIAVFAMGCIQCIMMPCCLLTLSKKVKPNQTVFATSVICAVAPNLSGVISPLIITNLSGLLFGESIRGRFTIAVVMSFIMAVVMLTMGLKGKAYAKRI